MVDYVHDHHCAFFDFCSKNGRDILWFPLAVPLNVSMYEFLHDIFTKYHVLLCQQEFKNDIKQEEREVVKNVSNSILEVLKIHKTGDVIGAYKMFESLMDTYYNDKLPTKTLEKGHTFYRMRADEFNLKDIKQFYHIPFKLRHLCTSYRFSISGYPCLYLGYSKSVCLAEISPNGTMCGVELRKENLKDLVILDLTFPEKSQNNNNPDNVMKFIRAWPLIASCYLVMANEQINRDSKFREEYIIPQMLTAYLKHKTSIHGICYYSTRNENLNPNGKGEEDYRNIVLFTNTPEQSDYDMNLIDMLHWYEPFNVGKIKQNSKQPIIMK